jgi:hypothetical protein
VSAPRQLADSAVVLAGESRELPQNAVVLAGHLDAGFHAEQPGGLRGEHVRPVHPRLVRAASLRLRRRPAGRGAQPPGRGHRPVQPQLGERQRRERVPERGDGPVRVRARIVRREHGFEFFPCDAAGNDCHLYRTTQPAGRPRRRRSSSTSARSLPSMFSMNRSGTAPPLLPGRVPGRGVGLALNVSSSARGRRPWANAADALDGVAHDVAGTPRRREIAVR